MIQLCYCSFKYFNKSYRADVAWARAEQDLGLRGEDSSSAEMETMASCFALSGFINARSVRSVCT